MLASLLALVTGCTLSVTSPGPDEAEEQPSPTAPPAPVTPSIVPVPSAVPSSASTPASASASPGMQATAAGFDPFDLPIYPGAREVAQQQTGDPRIVITTFRVTATREALLAWYKQVLVQKGWIFRVEYPEFMSFGYGPTPRNRWYNVYVAPTPRASGELAVELKIVEQVPH